ncbi:MAG: hypothetical protein ACQES9_07685 [Myxococcota bacterium]
MNKINICFNIFILFTTAILLSNCSSSAPGWKETKSIDTAVAYRKFLTNNPDTDEAYAAKIKLQNILYNRVKNLDELAAAKFLLHQFPSPAFRKKILKDLARKRARRALKSKDVWLMKRFLMLHPEAEQRDKIKKTLEKVWYQQLKASPDLEQLKHFLSFFSDSIYRKPARELLAKLEYKKLGSKPAESKLRLFALQYQHTKYGKKAIKQLVDKANIHRVLTGSLKELKIVLQQHPDISQKFILAALNRHLEKAITDVDPTKLEIVCGFKKYNLCSKNIKNIIPLWKKYSKSKKELIRSLVQKSLEWKPTASPVALEYALNSNNLRTNRIAFLSLAHLPEPKSFYLLLSRIGNEDPLICWQARQAFRTLFQSSKEWVILLTKYELNSIAKRLSDPGYLLRAVFLSSLLYPNKKTTSKLAKKLLAIKKKEPYKLALQLAIFKYFPKQIKQKQLLSALNQYLGRITRIFPESLEDANFALARRSLYRLTLFRIKLDETDSWNSDSKSFELFRKRIKSIEEKWENKLRKQKNYVSLQEISIAEKIEQWENSRQKNRKNLFRKGNKKFWKEYFSR